MKLQARLNIIETLIDIYDKGKDDSVFRDPSNKARMELYSQIQDLTRKEMSKINSINSEYNKEDL